MFSNLRTKFPWLKVTPWTVWLGVLGLFLAAARGRSDHGLLERVMDHPSHRPGAMGLVDHHRSVFDCVERGGVLAMRGGLPDRVEAL